MTPVRLALIAAALIGTTAYAGEPDRKPIEANTDAGERVLLHPNGRWEFVDEKKAEAARVVAKQFPENQGCPPGSQGGLLGFGRCIMPGDKDFNRGSLNPNRR